MKCKTSLKNICAHKLCALDIGFHRGISINFLCKLLPQNVVYADLRNSCQKTLTLRNF